MSQPVSVALCTRNGAQFIEAQLRSILNQSVQPHEVVLSDDASTDDTVAIARAVMNAESGPTLTVLPNPIALGVAANFEQAILACAGEFIALCDQDDVWHPHRLSRALQQFEAQPSLDLLFSDARLVDARGQSLDRSLFGVLEISADDVAALHRGDGLSLLIRRNIATGATVMFRRRLLMPALPFAPSWLHDEWLAAVGSAVGRVDAVEEQLIDYRQHGSNEIGVVEPTLIRKVQRVFEPRGDRNDRLRRQFAELASRLEGCPDLVHPSTLRMVREKSQFERIRAELPSVRLRRLPAVLAANRNGWYRKYASQGRLDMLRDLLQPHGSR